MPYQPKVELELDEESGLAMICDAFDFDADTSWASDRMSVHISTDADSKRDFLSNKEGAVEWMDKIAIRYALLKVKFIEASGDGDALWVDCAIFEYCNASGHVWLTLENLWDNLHFDMCPGTYSGWYQKYQARWTKLGSEYGLGKLCIRRSVEYDVKNHARVLRDPDRCLAFTSASFSLTFLIAMRAVYSVIPLYGRIDSKNGKRGFTRFIRGCLKLFPGDFTFSLRLDPDVNLVGGEMCWV